MAKYFNPESTKSRRSELRSAMPSSEVALWTRIRNRQVLDCKFRRQHGVGPYMLDFYAPEIELAVELDGDSHFEPGAAEADLRRQQFIESLGIQVVRFLNLDVHENLDAVVEKLTTVIVERRNRTGVRPRKVGSREATDGNTLMDDALPDL